MLSNSSKAKIILLFGAMLLTYGATIVKLYIVQISRTEFFTHKGKQQYLVHRISRPERGIIYDRTGKQPLAMNRESISAFIVPNSLHEPDKVAQFLKRHFPEAAQRLPKYRKRPFMYIKRHLTEEQRKLIETAELPDLQLVSEHKRYYPVESTGPIIGLTDSDQKGTMGLELWYNKLLAGTESSYSLEQDARSGKLHFTKELELEGTPSKPITLTIDSTLQFLAYEEVKQCMEKFHSVEGAALIMDPTNGDILAAVNCPDFNPNDVTNLDLITTKNRIFTETYELGSVMKIFLGIAGLAERIITPTSLIDCENKLHTTYQGIRINTVKPHGLLTFSQVIELSNNIGTTKVALGLGSKLYEHYRRCGFGTATGIQFPGEQRGHVTHPSTWSKQSLASLSFGYEIRATLLQLGTAFCMIANDGYSIKPRLVLSEAVQRGTEPLYSQETMQQIQEILKTTITKGNAQRANIKGYTVMGKTGTANLLIDGRYNTTKNIYTFAGIITRGSYKRVIITFIKEAYQPGVDMFASLVTAPLFEAIAEKMLIHEKII